MTELDISLHTILIKGIDRGVPMDDASFYVYNHFEELFGKDLIIDAQVIGDYNKIL